MKTTKLTLWGGYHHVASIDVEINASDAKDLEAGKISLSDIIEVLPYSDIDRLDKHFCGVQGCTCGSFYRASWEVAKNI